MNFYQNPYAYRKPVAKAHAPKFNHNADDVFAAACMAQRINGSYVKAIAPGIAGHKTNRMIVDELLADTTQLTQEDREQGMRVRTYYKGYTFKLLEGKTLSDFNNTAMTIAGKDVISSNYDLAVIVSLPASYEKSAKRDDVVRRINFATGGYIGDGSLSEKVTLNIEVLKSLWSQKWNTWYLTGITGEDQVVFFAHKTNYDVGTFLTITGNVKAHRDNSTQLSRVKVL
jgi:hypothetical protein